MHKIFVAIIVLVLGGFAFWSLQGELGKPEATAAEMATQQAMLSVVSAQKVYKQRTGNYAEHLYQLGPTDARLLPPVLAAHGTVAGYQLHLRGYGDSYQLSAEPPEGTDQRTFFADQSGVVRHNRGAAATASSPPVSQ